MKTGAVVVMDVLGFKGIWQRYDPKGIFQAMRDVEKMVKAACSLTNELEGDVWPSDIKPVYRFRFMSDTLFLACWFQTPPRTGPSDPIAMGGALWFLCRLTSRVLSVTSAIGFPLRGCVTTGKFDVLRNFVIGPAVDDAAQQERAANGAFVWVAPTAVGLYQIVDPDLQTSRRNIVYPYDVPLKDGNTIRTAVIDPRGDDSQDSARNSLRRVLEFFDSEEPDVCEKRLHTQKFFDHIMGGPVVTTSADA
jgi:hypothetical protein